MENLDLDLLRAAALGDLKSVKDVIKKGASLEASDENLWSALHFAANNGHVPVVQQLIKAGANVNAQNINGETPLLLASKNGELDVVSELLDNGADKEIVDANGRDPVFVATRENHFAVVERLLGNSSPPLAPGVKLFGNTDALGNFSLTLGNVSVIGEKRIESQNGQDEQELRDAAQEGDVIGVEEVLGINPDIDVDAVDSQGHSGLYLAAAAGRTETVRVLLENGADTETSDKFGHTPLWLASEGGHVKMVEVLLKYNANKDVRDAQGKTAVFIAAEAGNEDVIQVLLNADAKIDTPDNEDETPLFIASKKGQVAVLDVLVKHHADVDAENNEGLTPLHVAAQNGRAPIATKLLNSGAKLEARNTLGETPLFTASAEGQSRIVETLINAGASVNVSNLHSETPLYVASIDGHTEVVSMLLENGADTEARDTYGDTSLMVASQEGRTGVMTLLLKRGAKINAANGSGATALHFAAREGFQNAVDMLIKAGANVRAAEAKTGETALHVASRDGHVGVIQVLLNSYINIKEESNLVPLHLMTNNNGDTALHVATLHGHVHAMNLLINFDGQLHDEATSSSSTQVFESLINYQNRLGRAALHIAIDVQHRGGVELLLQRGAKVDIADKNGNTPLHDAARQRDSKIVAMVLERDARVNVVNVNGETPLHMATRFLLPDNVRELLGAGADVEAQDLRQQSPLDLVRQSNVTLPVANEIKIMLLVALNETNTAPALSPSSESTTLLNPGNNTALGNIPGPAPLLPGSTPSTSRESSSDLLPLILIAVPVLVIILFVGLWLYRKRHKQLSKPQNVEKKTKNHSLSLSFVPQNEKLTMSKRYATISMSQESKHTSFDVQAMVPVPVFCYEESPIQSEEDAGSGDENSSWTSGSCGWTSSDMSDDDCEGGGQLKRIQIDTGDGVLRTLEPGEIGCSPVQRKSTTHSVGRRQSRHSVGRKSSRHSKSGSRKHNKVGRKHSRMRHPSGVPSGIVQEESLDRDIVLSSVIDELKNECSIESTSTANKSEHYDVELNISGQNTVSKSILRQYSHPPENLSVTQCSEVLLDKNSLTSTPSPIHFRRLPPLDLSGSPSPAAVDTNSADEQDRAVARRLSAP